MTNPAWRVHAELSHLTDPEDWQSRHRLGELPDRLPYGLDRLSSHGLVVVARPIIRSRVVDRVVSGVVRRLTGGFECLEALTDSDARRRCDVALSWEERSGVPAALRSSFPGEPPAVTGVIWLTEPDARLGQSGRLLAVRGLARAAAIWALSPAQLGVLESEWKIPSRKLHFLPFGIDIDFWQSAGDDGTDDLVVGAGNDRHRDHSLLVEAVASVRRRRPSVRLELATSQPVPIPSPLGTRHPHLTHQEMRDLYARAAVVAVAVRSNLHVSGISVVLEAMACQRAVVATRTPGITEYIDDGCTGLLVPPGDKDHLAAAIGGLLADPERRHEMGRAAHAAVVRRHSTEHQAARLADLIRST